MSLDAAAPDVRATEGGVPRYAPWSLRVVAVLLDSAVLGTVTWLVAPTASAPELWPGLGPDPATGSEASTTVTSWTVLAVVVGLLLLQGWTGATVGKRAVGLVVVRADDGRPAGVVRTLVRQLAHVLDAILLVGYLRPLWEGQRRTFADSVTGTVVVVSPWPPAWRPVPPVVGRWARPVAGLVCGLGVVGLFPWSGGSAATPVDQPCEVVTGPAGVTAHVEWQVYRSWETRFGVRRELPGPDSPWTVTWRVPPGTSSDEVRVDTTVTGTGGATEGRTWHGGTTNTYLEDELTILGEVAVDRLPAASEVRVDSELVVDGTPVGTCSTVVRPDPVPSGAAP
ncbi:RDD family protein [Cellulomonas sp. zg-ZUI222]|uniref:RDD family protein n=1 Tax=Cellulomonas TaxID=1707 RepID=UPI001A944A1F|nr:MULTISPECIES: RDD family protein [Cellulomonas]MBO0900221.1 RDD family protein [Cellulomonas sp. zg-ZUI22]MBO0920865.1 RDD family protein [Cellulomonas wangleii]